MTLAQQLEDFLGQCPWADTKQLLVPIDSQNLKWEKEQI